MLHTGLSPTRNRSAVSNIWDYGNIASKIFNIHIISFQSSSTDVIISSVMYVSKILYFPELEIKWYYFCVGILCYPWVFVTWMVDVRSRLCYNCVFVHFWITSYNGMWNLPMAVKVGASIWVVTNKYFVGWNCILL